MNTILRLAILLALVAPVAACSAGVGPGGASASVKCP
jgi:hypothetical protein